MALSRDAILKHAGMVGTREVHVPEWADESGDDVVLVRGMTGREWDVHSARIQRNAADDKEPTANLTAGLICRVIVDDTGKRLFTDADENVVGELSAGSLSKLSAACLEESGLTDASEKAIEGNSSAAPSGSSSSTSQ